MLGDIPLVGELFRLRRSTSSKTELYIVITPHIVRHRRFEQPASNATGDPAQLPVSIAVAYPRRRRHP